MHPIVVLTGLICVAGVLGVSGWHKLTNPIYYRDIVKDYIPMSETRALMVNRFVGVFELVLATLLLVAPVARFSAVAAVALLFGYFCLLTTQLLRGRTDMDCGCSGPADGQTISPWLLFRNATLIGLVSFEIAFPVTTAVGIESWLIGIMSGCFLLVIYFLIGQLMSNTNKLQKLRVGV